MNWFAAKVKSHTERKIKKWLTERGIEHFIPFHNVIIERNGRRFRKEKPWISGLIFIHAEQKEALKIQHESIIKMYFLKKKETGTMLIIPDKQMQDFMFMLEFSEAAIRIDSTNLKQGDRVRVIKGDFAGIEGELIRIRGHKRVVVRLEGLFSLATAYIPPSFLEKI
ncbi:MAG: UpxY family transcription antiterminator [Prevotellaceae bacterium]|jgi:transcription antitermination factor NusG|nr:UpxY family transcription antiterminator [Prevotellaceae bacterium]